MSEHHLGEDLMAMAEGGAGLTAERQQAHQRHLLGCPECQAALAQSRRVLALVERLPNIEPSPAFVRALERRLDAVDQEAESTFWARLKAALTMPRLAGAFAVAAAILCVVLSLQPSQAPAPSLETLEVAENLELYQDLEVVENLDVLEELELIETLEAGEAG